MGNQASRGKECIFCQISQNKLPETKLLAENEKIVVFKDRSPASKQHYLVVPKEHLVSPKTLCTEEHVELVNEMVSYGTEYLKQQGGNVTDMKIGFHWPPFTSVHHLHLHVIFPASEMPLMHKIIYSNQVFVTPDYVVNATRAKLQWLIFNCWYLLLHIYVMVPSNVSQYYSWNVVCNPILCDTWCLWNYGDSWLPVRLSLQNQV